MTKRAMPISILALCAVFICISCAGPRGASSDVSPEGPESPVRTHLERSCEKIDASGEPRPLEALAKTVASLPVRIAPAGSHFGFDGDGKNVVYTFPKGGTLYAVSADGGEPRGLADGVSYWFEATQAGELIYDSRGTLYRVGVNGAKPRPAPEAVRPIDRKKSQQRELGEAGYSGANPTLVSQRWLAGDFGTTAEDYRLAIIDRRDGTSRIASLEDQRLIWSQQALKNGREIAYLTRDADNRAAHLWTADAETGAVRCISAAGDGAIMPFFADSADSRHMSYTRYTDTGHRRREFTLHLADIERGDDILLGAFEDAYTVVPKAIPDPRGEFDKPRFVVAVQYAARDTMAFFLVEGADVRRLSDEFAGWSNFYVSPDGAWLLFQRSTPPEQRHDSPQRAEGGGLYILALP